MKWPERPTCHPKTAPFRRSDLSWTKRGGDTRNPDGEPFRRCSYCGSIHPEDLIAALDAGGVLSGSDWKYGWPHKFYLIVPNPNRDRTAEIGSSSEWNDEKGERVDTPIMGSEGDFNAKWYNEHLQDDGYDDEARALILERIKQASNIEFRFSDDGRLQYSAPYFGYQP